MRKIVCFIICSVCLWAGVVSAQTLKIGVDSNFWYPYSYVENDRVMGLHVDIITLALNNLGYDYVINKYPWKRCLIYAKMGKVDAILSLSFKKERAEYLVYPPKAAMPGKADYRVTQVQYSIVSKFKDSYDFDGNMKSLPRPVMVPLGYSIGEDLKKEGVPINENISDIINFRILNLTKGCLITLPQTAKLMMKLPEFKGKLYLSKNPLKSKSYFFAFSKKNRLPQVKRLEIWEEIKRIREDNNTIALFMGKY